MKKILLMLLLVPVQAWAVDGKTVFNGPEVPILETVAQDFPRYDLDQQCKLAMPGTNSSAQSAQATCKIQQGRLAGLASQAWGEVPVATRLDCVKRADRASDKRYAVLFSCVHAATFRVHRRDAIEQAAERIARQNGKIPVDSQAVGSIR